MVRVKLYAIVFGHAFKDKANNVELCGTISQVIQTLRANKLLEGNFPESYWRCEIINHMHKHEPMIFSEGKEIFISQKRMESDIKLKQEH